MNAVDVELAGPSETGASHDVGIALRTLDRLFTEAIAAAEPLLGPPGADPYRGLYVGAADALDSLSREPGSAPPWLHFSTEDRPGAPLGRLSQEFNLSEFDLDVVALALAPELDLRYERVYAYLQDDITRKRPTVSFALDFFATAAERLSLRARFAPDAPLVRGGVIELVPDPQQPSPPLLAHTLVVDPQIVRLLVGEHTLDPRLAPFVELVDPDETGAVAWNIEPGTIGAVPLTAGSCTAVHLRCARPRARFLAASELVRGTGRRMLFVDLAAASEGGLDVGRLARTLTREAWILDAVLFVDGLDHVLDDRKWSVHHRLLAEIGLRRDLTLLGGEAPLGQYGLSSLPVIDVPLETPGVAARRSAWDRALHGRTSISVTELDALAVRFRLAPDQIFDSVRLACARARTRSRRKRPMVSDLILAARAQAGDGLASLAQRVETPFGWDDIVLSADEFEQLREICSHVRRQTLVFHDWGFKRKAPLGTGLSVLFAGPPGTGKTMAAAVIAAELGVHLYRIDLSQVVDKYIGETEKRLERVFTAAETSDAVLLFDECDALFGRRSEVRDAHDRFANIEVAYLLQRMESFEGISILATNFRNNLDRAFLRRLRFVVDFPNPDEEHRLEIWKRVWPREVKVARDVDLAFLARQFELSGGQIRNVAVNAAFRAAERRGPVQMADLVGALRREFQKAGRLCVDEEFGEYRHLVREAKAA